MFSVASFDTDAHHIALPPYPGDGEWPYAVVTNSGEVFVSDSVSDLVAVGLPGYGDLADNEDGFDDGLVARYEDLLGHAAAFQHTLLSEAHERGLVNISDLDDDTLTYLMEERSVPFEGESPWECLVPLVLIATDYEPYTERRIPEGNIVWLDPITEVTYLQSLCKVGALRFMFSNGIVPITPDTFGSGGQV